MRDYNYKVKYRRANFRNIKVKFSPYINDIAYLNQELSGWTANGVKAMSINKSVPLIPGGIGSTQLTRAKNDFSIARTLTDLTPDTSYLVSVFVRNNSVASTTLSLNGNRVDEATDKYTKRIYGFGRTSPEGELELELAFHKAKTYNQTDIAVYDVWIDGFFAAAVPEEAKDLLPDDLLAMFRYTDTEVMSPTPYLLLRKMLNFLPYRYYLSQDGVRIADYHTGLDALGVLEDAELECFEVDPNASIFQAMKNDYVLMAMLGGKATNLTHAFPKEGIGTSTQESSHFPRVQFFTGFEVATMIADSHAYAVEVNYALNVYVPVYKVLESVNANMIMIQARAIMSQLGWAPVRGSDYFRKNEQLYVVQLQFIQDLIVAPTRR